jgi:hypothetical protein
MSESRSNYRPLELFIKSHYAVIQKQYLIPEIVEGQLIFPEKATLVRKRLKFYHKLKYYILDFIMWCKYGSKAS